VGQETGQEGRETVTMSLLSADAAEAVTAPSVDPTRPEAATRWELLGQLEKTALGTRLSDGSATVRRGEMGGCLLFGPYWHFPAGRYRLEFRCSARRPVLLDQPVLGVEVIVLGRFQQAWRDFTAAELGAGAGALVFEIPPELGVEAGNESRFEFRFFHLGNADLTVNAVELCRIEAEGAAPADAREWRLLGRLRKSWIGKRHRDGRIGLRRAGPKGCVVYGGWPYLRLAMGNYRLTVQCGVAASRLPVDPVLGVEILGRSFWAGGPWQSLMRAPRPGGTPFVVREFTGEEVQAGPLSVDFALPADMSLESGADAPIEVRLHHSGRAELTITAVDLRALGPEEMPAAAPPLETLRRRVAHRQRLVLIGNCQCRTLAQAFNHAGSLNKKFEAKYHFIPLPGNLQEFAILDLEACDVLLIQDIHLWDDSPLRQHVRPGAEIIKFPFARFASLWPFDGWNGPSDREAQNRESPNMTFPFLDGLLARLRKDIPDKEARFASYRALDIAGIINYRRLHELEKRRLIGIDRKYGIALGEFTLENFRKRQVFHTTVRPNWQGFNLLARFILKSIGIRAGDLISQKADMAMRDPHVPVHPKVARELGVTWADERTRYLSHGREVTWEAYIRRYIEHYG
jgi:hypothetical protein